MVSLLLPRDNLKGYNMKKFIMAAVGLLATISVASAQDLRADRSGFYVGGTVGSTMQDTSQTNLGGVAGYQINRFLRVEGTYDYLPTTVGPNGHVLALNGVAQYRIPTSVLTPYVLAGVGAGFDSFGTASGGDIQTLFAVGGGVRMAVSTNVELDARYRYISQFGDSLGTANANVVTVGANWRF